jgi:hypothetical protein
MPVNDTSRHALEQLCMRDGVKGSGDRLPISAIIRIM